MLIYITFQHRWCCWFSAELLCTDFYYCICQPHFILFNLKYGKYGEKILYNISFNLLYNVTHSTLLVFITKLAWSCTTYSSYKIVYLPTKLAPMPHYYYLGKSRLFHNIRNDEGTQNSSLAFLTMFWTQEYSSIKHTKICQENEWSFPIILGHSVEVPLAGVRQRAYFLRVPLGEEVGSCDKGTKFYHWHDWELEMGNSDSTHNMKPDCGPSIQITSIACFKD